MYNTMQRISTLLLIGLIALSAATAGVKPNGLISDNAVLQRGTSVPIWGTADQGEKVTVGFQGQTVSTIARNGQWIVRLKPLKAGGPFTMRINDLEFKNILVGEVWICSGQSNMAFTVAKGDNAESAVAASKDSMLRLLTVPQNDNGEPALAWQECGPDTVGSFSAVGYFFGRDLRKELDVPVGLINSSVGGTPAEAWTSRAVIRANPDLRYLLRDPVRTGKGRPGGLYDAMIVPLQPYAMRGVIWYQGEANASRAQEYRTLFPAMIADWRNAWGQGDFPFLFVQLAPFTPKLPEGAWAELRQAQLVTAITVPNTAMAVITDLGEENDIHPKKKEPVGERLALAARALVYGEQIEYSGPMYTKSVVLGDKVILCFDHVDGGLVVRGETLAGFAIAGADGNYVPAKAEIRRDKCVLVSSPQVSEPTAVRYGWSNWMAVNLYNKAGLPASPFCTCDFPMKMVE